MKSFGSQTHLATIGRDTESKTLHMNLRVSGLSLRPPRPDDEETEANRMLTFDAEELHPTHSARVHKKGEIFGL